MSNKKRIISGVLCAVMTLSILVFVPKTVEAKSAYNVINVTDLGTGKTVTEKWTNNHHKEAYYSFTMKKNGFVSFSVTKPVLTGKYSSDLKHEQKVAILDKNKKEVWVSNTEKSDDLNSSKASFKTGLKKGKYYLCIRPLSLTVMSYQSATTKLTLSTTARNNYEIESNSTKKSANELKLGKTFTGTFCDEYDSDDYNHAKDDWYKVKLKKGKKYTITLGKYKNLRKKGRKTLVYVSNGSKNIDTKTLIKKGSYTFKATKNGYYYIRLWNDSQHKSTEYQITVKKK